MRVALFCLLAVAASPAFSELIPVGETAAAVNYVDPSQIRKDGDMRGVWVVLDLKKSTAAGAKSIRALHEFDCREARFTTLASFDHAEPRASGKIIRTGTLVDKWAPIAPDSIADSIRQMVCVN